MRTPSQTPGQLEKLYYDACMAEIQALKPGNVHIFADGHGMTVQDFIKSAEVTAPIICAPNLSLGERILQSVQATQNAVHCNTNLGIILLCAPLIHSTITMPCEPISTRLAEHLKQVLNNTTIEDAHLCFKAIALANPAGLGDSALHDVRQPADCTLLQAMQFAAARDLIARQYANNFADIFDFGVNVYLKSLGDGNNAAWSTTALYLTLLAEFEDSHIVRKHGVAAARALSQQAALHLANLKAISNPKRYQKELLEWDAQLKATGVNPGTCADLTVAILLVVAIVNMQHNALA